MNQNICFWRFPLVFVLLQSIFNFHWESESWNKHQKALFTHCPLQMWQKLENCSFRNKIHVSWHHVAHHRHTTTSIEAGCLKEIWHTCIMVLADSRQFNLFSHSWKSWWCRIGDGVVYTWPPWRELYQIRTHEMVWHNWKLIMNRFLWKNAFPIFQLEFSSFRTYFFETTLDPCALYTGNSNFKMIFQTNSSFK